jgi:hypothetical protein
LFQLRKFLRLHCEHLLAIGGSSGAACQAASATPHRQTLSETAAIGKRRVDRAMLLVC